MQRPTPIAFSSRDVTAELNRLHPRLLVRVRRGLLAALLLLGARALTVTAAVALLALAIAGNAPLGVVVAAAGIAVAVAVELVARALQRSSAAAFGRLRGIVARDYNATLLNVRKSDVVVEPGIPRT